MLAAEPIQKGYSGSYVGRHAQRGRSARASYEQFLEAQLGQAVNASLEVQAAEKKIEGIASAVSTLDQKLLNVVQLVKYAHTYAEERERRYAHKHSRLEVSFSVS